MAEDKRALGVMTLPLTFFLILAIVRRFTGDLDVMDVAFPQAGIGDPTEFGIFLQSAIVAAPVYPIPALKPPTS